MSETWKLVRITPRGRIVSQPINIRGLGTIRIYFASMNGDRVVTITVSKPKRGKRKNKPTVLTVIDEKVVQW